VREFSGYRNHERTPPRLKLVRSRHFRVAAWRQGGGPRGWDRQAGEPSHIPPQLRDSHGGSRPRHSHGAATAPGI